MSWIYLDAFFVGFFGLLAWHRRSAFFMMMAFGYTGMLAVQIMMRVL